MQILCECGFETRTAILKIDPAKINEIEQYVNEDLSMLKNTSYKDVSHFKLRPGHRLFILDLPNRINHWNETNIRINRRQFNMTDFSHVLRTFIETVEENYGKEPKGFRYNETNRYFSLFIYLMCGRACYETLSANLPIPQAITISKFAFSDLLYCITFTIT